MKKPYFVWYPPRWVVKKNLREAQDDLIKCYKSGNCEKDFKYGNSYCNVIDGNVYSDTPKECHKMLIKNVENCKKELQYYIDYNIEDGYYYENTIYHTMADLEKP